MTGAPHEIAVGWLMLCDLRIHRAAWVEAEDCLQQLLVNKALSFDERRGLHARMATVSERMGNRDRAAFERKLAQPAQ
jgi:hypothetical protein